MGAQTVKSFSTRLGISLRRPTLHFRNGVSEYVLLQTPQTPSFSQRVPATQNKKNTLQHYMVDGN